MSATNSNIEWIGFIQQVETMFAVTSLHHTWCAVHALNRQTPELRFLHLEKLI